MLIDAEAIRKNVKAADVYVEIKSDEGGNIEISCFNKKGVKRCTFFATNDDTEYPKYEKLFRDVDESPKATIAFNATFLAEMCKAAAVAFGDNVAISMTSCEDSKVYLFESKSSEHGKMRALLMPVRMDYKDNI